MTQVIVHHNTDPGDHSDAANNLNIQNMVNGVVAITRAAANLPLDTHNTLTWDDSDMNLPSLPLLSPRPLTNIMEAEEGVSSDSHSQQDSEISRRDTNQDVMSSIRQMMRDQLENACKNIEASIMIKLSETAEKVVKNTEDILTINARIG